MSRSLKWRAQRRKERQEKQQSNHTASYAHNHKLEALYLQRHLLDELIRKNKINNIVAAQIRENINYNKIYCLYSPNIKQDITIPPYI